MGARWPWWGMRGVSGAWVCAVVVGVVGLVGVVPRAVAQEVIARDVYIDEHLLSVDDVEFLRDAAGFSGEQTEAAVMLLAGAKEQLATARRRQERAERRMYELEDEEAQQKEYRRYMERYVEDCATAEQEFMGDLRALLTSAQQEKGAWQRFERSRRRLLIRNTVNLERLDMVSILRNTLGAGKGPGAVPTDAELASAIEQYESEMDLLVQQRRPLAKVLGRNTLGWVVGREENEKADADCRAVAIRMMELNARAARSFARLLSEQQKDAFDVRYIRAVWGGSLPRLDRDQDVAEVMRLRGLTPAQKDEMKRIVAEAEREILEKCRTRLTKWEHAAVAYLRQEQVADEEDFYNEHIVKTQKDVRRRVFEVLTPAQREAYEDGAGALEEPVVNEDEGRRPDEY